MKTITVPRISVNENLVTIGQWNVSDGQYVKKKQLIGVLETTKETRDIFANADGYIYLKAEEGIEVPVGTAIAEITEEIREEQKPFEDCQTVNKSAVKTMEPSNDKITQKARKLIIEHNVDINLLPKDKIIRESDVQKLIHPDFFIDETKGNHVIIYGTGGWARDIIDIISQTNQYKIHCIIGGIGDYNDKESILGIPIVSNNVLDDLYDQGYRKAINAVAVTPNAFSRKDIYNLLKERDFDFPNIIHRSAQIGTEVQMGVGNLIFGNAVIGPQAKIGSNCVINANATVHHECIVSDTCHIASGAVLAGKVTVGTNTLIGQGCMIYTGVKIGSNVLIQNGCHIFKDVPDNAVVRNES